MVLKKIAGAVALSVALGIVLSIASGVKAVAGNKGVFPKGYMYGPPSEEVLATTYTVVKGDCLWNIAKSIYGDASKWKKIYGANMDKIKNPDLIYPGQVLVIAR